MGYSSHVTLEYRRCIRTHVYRVWCIWFTIKRSDVDSFRIRKGSRFVETFIREFNNISPKSYRKYLFETFRQYCWRIRGRIRGSVTDFVWGKIGIVDAFWKKPNLLLVWSKNRELLTQLLFCFRLEGELKSFLAKLTTVTAVVLYSYYLLKHFRGE